MPLNRHLFIRRAHRYLGVFIGVQILLWTISGLYFTWNDIDDVHGDTLRKLPHFIESDSAFVSPSVAIRNLRDARAVDSIAQVRLINIVRQPVYQIAFFSGHAAHGIHPHLYHALADARTGALRPALSEQEAIQLARDYIATPARVASVSWIEKTDGHDEYRNKPLPAWAVHFEEPSCTAYISSEQGTFQAVRHDQWRMFDFLWMFHTMDYEGRDDFNNLIIRVFSALGLITVASGFALFFVSRRKKVRSTNQ